MFEVILSDTAKRDLGDIYHYIAADAPGNADHWAQNLLAKVASLCDMPRRFPIAAESETHPIEIRQMTIGNYRVLFIIEDTAVHILHIRHSARRGLRPDELRGLLDS